MPDTHAISQRQPARLAGLQSALLSLTLFTAAGLASALWAIPAWASVGVRFVEGAPKDRFEITNLAACALTNTDVTIDLGTSAAGLIFDTTSTGAGVNVFQPFELVEGARALASHTPVNDGDTQVVLSVRQLAPGGRIAFTVDVDDTITQRGITVSGSEIEGATVRVNAAATGHASAGRFSALGQALASAPPCR